MAFVNDGHVLCIYIETTRRFTQTYTPGSSRIFKVAISANNVHEPVVQPMPRRAQDWIPGGATWVTRYIQSPPLFTDDALLLTFLTNDDMDLLLK